MSDLKIDQMPRWMYLIGSGVMSLILNCMVQHVVLVTLIQTFVMTLLTKKIKYLGRVCAKLFHFKQDM